MVQLSASLLSAIGLLAPLVAGQDPIALPQQSGAAGGGVAPNDCSGCYIVADVAGIAFGTQTISAAATQVQVVNPGRNGSAVVTSVFLGAAPFTAGPSGVAAPGGSAAGIAYNTDGTTLVISGVTLTSPTAYNVFTAYAVTSKVYTNGQCSIVGGPKTTLNSAFSVVVPPNVANFASFQYEAEKSFISGLPQLTCAPGGENYAQTTHIPVVISTTSITTTASQSLTPSPASVATTVAATTTGPTGLPTVTAVSSTFIPFSPIANASRTTYLPGGTGTIVLGTPLVPSQSIVQAGAARATVGAWFAGAVALLAGFAA